MINIQRSAEIRIKRANTDWWIHEQSMVGANGMTYIAYYNDIGEIRVKEFDAKCSRAVSRDVCVCRLNCNYADEHNAPSICVMENGTIVVAYTGHSATHALYYRVTERPYDLLSFGPEQTLEYDAPVTYAQLSENVSRGELWLFTRVNGVTWEFRYSSDAGATWSEANKFLESEAGGLFYFDIHRQLVCSPERGAYEQWFFALYGHPLISADHTVRSGIFDADGNLLNMDGKSLEVNLYNGENKIDLEALDKVYEAPAKKTVRLCAVSPLPPYRVGLACFAPNKPGTITYYSATYRSGKWNLSKPIAKGGEFLSPKTMVDGSQSYVGGMCYYYGVGTAGLHPNDPAPTCTDRIYLARFDGKFRVLESYLTADNGKNYELEQVIRKIPKAQNVKIWRPVAPIYAMDNLPVYWHEGVYGAHTGGWHSDVVAYVEFDDVVTVIPHAEPQETGKNKK
ncbi:MAG: BNR-4 repeat-containing protein [Clostridia bacterium]|nr:BNR-4 repeat-containing protein [Clostridia bacterium]